MAEWKDKNGVLCIGLRVDPKANKGRTRAVKSPNSPNRAKPPNRVSTRSSPNRAARKTSNQGGVAT